MIKKDDWEKPRSKGQHLTTAEIAFLRSSFETGCASRDAARALKCSSRIASKYYGLWRAEGIEQNVPKPSLPPLPKSPFYKGSFDL
jgi:hypothetical protein